MNYKDAINFLELGDNITQEVIRSNYKRLAKKYHPDTQTGSEELFKKLQSAHDFLLANLEDASKTYIINPLRQKRKVRRYDIKDVVLNVESDLKELYEGTTFDVKFHREYHDYNEKITRSEYVEVPITINSLLLNREQVIIFKKIGDYNSNGEEADLVLNIILPKFVELDLEKLETHYYAGIPYNAQNVTIDGITGEEVYNVGTGQELITVKNKGVIFNTNKGKYHSDLIIHIKRV